MLVEPLKSTYRVSLQAMILEEIHRVRYQKQLFKCAQFLIDNECKNGQWSYGEATTYPEPASDFVATMYHALGYDSSTRVTDPTGKSIAKVALH